jgi:two-component system cell cycle sensor histidine kinase/response regulator CckA
VDAPPTLVPGPYVILTVADTGIGMDEEIAARIFEPFFTTKPLGKGTGLGLSTAYGIARQSGGDIAVMSAPGQGTTFSVYLPRISESSVAEAVPVPLNPAESAAQSGDELILVVDDEDGVRSLVRRALQRRGYRVLEARAAGEALELLATHRGNVDLMFSDVAMPGMSGRDLAACVSETWPDVAILLSSGQAFLEADLAATPEAARYAFLEKPFTVDQLIARIRTVLGRSRQTLS